MASWPDPVDGDPGTGTRDAGRAAGPGALRIVARPPTSRARSSMPSSPKPAAARAAQPNPAPASATVRRSRRARSLEPQRRFAGRGMLARRWSAPRWRSGTTRIRRPAAAGRRRRCPAGRARRFGREPARQRAERFGERPVLERRRAQAALIDRLASSRPGARASSARSSAGRAGSRRLEVRQARLDVQRRPP